MSRAAIMKCMTVEAKHVTNCLYCRGIAVQGSREANRDSSIYHGPALLDAMCVSCEYAVLQPRYTVSSVAPSLTH